MSILKQAVRVYRSRGVVSLLKRLPNSKKTLDYTVSRLLRPVEKTMWGTYMISTDNLYDSTLSSNFVQVYGKNADYGIYGGTWDTYSVPFEETPMYQTMYQRFVDGTDWENTVYFEMAKRRIRQGSGSAWNGCRSVDDLHNRCEYIDELYHSIKNDGYKHQLQRKEKVDKYEVRNELIIGIDRDGNPLRLANGRHRASIAKILDVEIPAVVTIVHKNQMKNSQHLSL